MEPIGAPDPARGRVVLAQEALTRAVIGAFYDVYNALGFGFLERVYAGALAVELSARGLAFSREHPLDVWYRGVRVGRYRADFLVERTLVVELKATAGPTRADAAQVFNYLRAAQLEVGLLLNFGPEAVFRRVIAFPAGKPSMPRRARRGATRIERMGTDRTDRPESGDPSDAPVHGQARWRDERSRSDPSDPFRSG